MAMNELGLDNTSSALFTEEEIINTYLFGSSSSNDSSGGGRSYHNPNEYEYIINKIRTDLGERSILVEKVTKSKLELKKLLVKRNELRAMLDQLPNKLQELHTVGESLYSFFDTATSAATASDGNALSKDDVLDANSLVCRTSIIRSERFDLARSNLPSPLYVLYVQLQGYIDAWATIEKLGGEEKEDSVTHHGLVGVAGMDVSVIEIQDVWKVVLTLIPSNITPSVVSSILLGGKTTPPPYGAVRIVFSFDIEWGVIRALSMEGEDGKVNTTFDGLLDNLFPGDVGLVNPNVSLSFLNQNNDDDADDDDDIIPDDEDGKKKAVDDHSVVVTTTTVDSSDKNSTVEKPYYWCQVLGGLDFPPPPGINSSSDSVKVPPIQTCTKAVFRQLLRRIRARMTLMAILDYLGKKSNLYGELPLHPAMRKEQSSDGGANQRQSKAMAKLTSWVEDSKTSAASTKSYTAIVKRKTVILKAFVVIDMYNYPTEPPVWSLLKNNEDGVFYTVLHKIECRVNEELKEYVHEDVEDTYDWLLLHQLADIVSCWDEVMRMKDEGRG
jgi:hypothetical protein